MQQPPAHDGRAGKAWGMLAVIYFAGLAAPFNQFKIPPVLHQLRLALGVNLAEAGLLMSIFSLVGVVLALPSGLLLGRIGTRATGILALVCLCAGSTAGGLAPDAGWLLASRALEGVGMCLIFVMAPAAIALWFPGRGRGAAMGVWGSWVPVGAILMLSLAPAVSAAAWGNPWWAGAGYALAMLACFALFFRAPAGAEAPAPSGRWTGMLAALRNRDVWLLGLVFCTQNVMFLSVSTFMPMFLESTRGMSNEAASGVTGVIMLCCAISGAACGFISGRLPSRKPLIAAPMLVLMLLLLLPFRIGPEHMTALMVCIGLFTGLIPTAIFILVQEVCAGREEISMGLGVVALGQNLGMFAGPALFGAWVDSFGWVMAAQLLMPFGLVGFVAALFLRTPGARPQAAAQRPE
jgi:predicted MFS family arabinose efflux permease